MKIAFKPYSDAPESQRPLGIPLQCPWMCCSITEEQIPHYVSNKFIIMTEEEYEEYNTNIAPSIDAWQTARTQLGIEAVVSAATSFGQSIMISFAAENVLLGITQEGKTGEVLGKLSGVQLAVNAGSLYEAISRIRAINPADYDAKYITAARLLAFINKIETYLGLPISTEL